MDIRTIKGVGIEKWRRFKELAAKKNLSMGALFEIVIEDYSKRDDYTWNEILKGDKIVSDKEAEELKLVIKEIRKEKGFRV